MDKIKLIINAMQQDPRISAAKIAMQLGVSSRSIEKRIRTMRENGIIRRIGPDKGGFWELLITENETP
jgi:ATP-dependent DNA helicase RecG